MSEEATRFARLRTAGARLLAALDELLFPERVRCLCCSHALDEDEADDLCPDCCAALERMAVRQEGTDAARTEPLPPGLDYVSAAFPYEEQVRRLIWLLKFRGVREAAVPLARAMARLSGGEEELIVPVPTTRRRLRERGFNQAALLARALSRTLGMPLEEALVRTDDRAAQSTLSAGERRRNLVGCMRADERVRGKRVLLVDDVYTTGATAGEAARALLSAGATGVGMFAAARTAPLAAQARRETPP